MAHSRTREFETLIALVGAQYTSDQFVKYPIVALLSVLEVLDEYWDIVENQPDDIDEDFQGRTIDTIEEVIHSWLVHQQELPVEQTEAERIAAEDQLAADLREQIEEWSRESGSPLKIIDLDQQLFKNKEGKDGEE